MIINTNKQRGNAGIGLAIGYYSTNGYTVSVPLNDTQDYDIIVDNGTLLKVQAKFSSQKSKYGFSIVPLRSLGGTTGAVYKRVIDTDVDVIFFANPDGEMWSIPKNIVTQQSTINLGKKFDKYRVKI